MEDHARIIPSQGGLIPNLDHRRVLDYVFLGPVLPPGQHEDECPVAEKKKSGLASVLRVQEG
jgi:hypothetical protein